MTGNARDARCSVLCCAVLCCGAARFGQMSHFDGLGRGAQDDPFAGLVRDAQHFPV